MNICLCCHCEGPFLSKGQPWGAGVAEVGTRDCHCHWHCPTATVTVTVPVPLPRSQSLSLSRCPCPRPTGRRVCLCRRRVYEEAVEALGEWAKDEKLFVAFAKFEERQREYERARAIFRYALPLPQTPRCRGGACVMEDEVWGTAVLEPPPPPSPLEEVAKAVGGGALSVTNAIEAGIWRQGDSGWA